MDRSEKLQYEQGIEHYFDEHKVYDLFEKMFKELIINKPEQPVDYLIEQLQRKDQRRIFITGYPGTLKKGVSLAMSGALGYSCLSVDHLLEREISKKLENAHQIEENYNINSMVDDSIVIELVRNQLIKYEENNESYIIEGFPKNRTQAIFLQSVGLLPDNMILLKTTREKAEERVYKKLKERGQFTDEEQLKILAKNSVDEAELNIRAVEDIYNGFYCELPVEKYTTPHAIVDELAHLLKFKAKTNAARRPPRIIFAAPPSCGKMTIVKKVAQRLNIIPISILELLQNEIAKKNDNAKIILDAINNNESVPDKFVLKLLEDRLFRSDCMINGWIVTGFPYNQSQINFIYSMNPALKPSLIAMLDMDEKLIREKASKIRFDPQTGKMYRIGSKKANALDEEVTQRLIPRMQDSEERMNKRIEVWKKVSSALSLKNVLMLNGEEKKKKICELIEDAVGYNS